MILGKKLHVMCHGNLDGASLKKMESASVNNISRGIRVDRVYLIVVFYVGKKIAFLHFTKVIKNAVKQQ